MILIYIMMNLSSVHSSHSQAYPSRMKPQLLYKIHGVPDCDMLQQITKYLYAIGIDMRPNAIIERSFPKNIHQNDLPIIVINDNTLIGLKAIVDHYEKELKIDNLINKSIEFMKLNPKYQISDKSSHKNIKFPYF